MKELMVISLDGRSGNMKNLFNKDNFILSSFDAKQKRQSLFIAIALVFFFVLSAFTFFNMLYAFADQIGSIVCSSMDVALKDFLRSIPLYLTFFMSLWTILLLQASFRNVNDEKRLKSLKKDAICLLAFAGVNFIYIIIMLIAGKYVSLVEGSPSPFYPLDSILYSLIYVAIGVFTLLWVKKLNAKLPYVLPQRGEVVTKARGLYCTFITFFVLISLFGFSAGIYSLFIYDFMHEYAFYGVGTICIYLLSPVFLGVWEFYYNELKEEKKKEVLLPLAIIGVIVASLFTALYFISLATNLDAPSNAGFGMFPVAFAASTNIPMMIVAFTPLIFAITALIKGLLLRKQK